MSVIEPPSIDEGVTPLLERCFNLDHGFVVDGLRFEDHADGQAKGIAKAILKTVQWHKLVVSHDQMEVMRR